MKARKVNITAEQKSRLEPNIKFSRDTEIARSQRKLETFLKKESIVPNRSLIDRAVSSIRDEQKVVNLNTYFLGQALIFYFKNEKKFKRIETIYEAFDPENERYPKEELQVLGSKLKDVPEIEIKAELLRYVRFVFDKLKEA